MRECGSSACYACSEVKFDTKTHGAWQAQVEGVVHEHGIVVPEGVWIVLAVDQGLVLSGGEVTIVIGHTCESVDRVDVARVQDIAHPQVNVEVGGLCISFCPSISDGEVAV